MKKWLLPLRLMVIFLAIFGLWASFSWSDGSWAMGLVLARNFLLILLGEVAIFFVLCRLGVTGFSRWEHFAITALILFLLFDSLNPWWVFLAAGIISQFFVRLLRTPIGPLFNPAATGGFILALAGFFPSWWGTNFEPRFSLLEGGMSIAFFLTLFIAGYIAYKYKKLPIIGTAVVTFLIAEWLLIGQDPFYVIFEGTFAFFLFVMAVEPKTTPNGQRDQLIYGALLGLLVPLGIRLNIPEAYLGALLLANLFASRRWLKGLFAEDKEAMRSRPVSA